MKRIRTGEETSAESLLGRVADEYTQRLHNGETPDVEEYAERYPELAAIIRQVLPALHAIRAAGAAASSAAGDLLDARAVTARTLGDYRLLREIGRGGMGVVYEAIQVSLNRHVALKTLPQAAVMDPRQLQRFKNEARAAARLHHDNIVPVHAVGCEGGIQYYAMQFIDGAPLTAVIGAVADLAEARAGGADVPIHEGHAPAPTNDAGGPVADSATLPRTASCATAEAALTALSRSIGRFPDELMTEDGHRTPAYYQAAARLALQAAEALFHAHELGVVHRDIKPGNLLLDATGRVWVADFGLAIIQADPGLTTAGDLLGTVRYMSPEQARMKTAPVDHRTDIYSLGATLYELLALAPAFGDNDRRVLVHKITTEAPRPVRRVDPQIPKPLATIVGKAMAKRPEDRYASADELADDLRRFLADRPILAQPPTALDRVSMWARRHRSAVATAVLLLALTVVTLAASTVLILRERSEAIRQRNEAWQQRERAEANYRLARDAMDRMLTRMSDEALGSTAQLERVRQALLEDSLDFHEQLLHTQSPGASVQRDSGYAYMRVGHINALLGEEDRAEDAYRKAIAVYEQLVTANPDVSDFAAELAKGYMAMATLLWEQRRYEETEAPIRSALAILHNLSTANAASTDLRQALARAYNLLGLGQNGRGAYADAESALRQAVEIRAALRNENPWDPQHRVELARTWRNLADVQIARGRQRDAEALMQQIMALQENLVRDFPEALEYGAELAHTKRWWHKVQQTLAAPSDGPAFAEEAPPLIEDKRAVELPSLPWYQERLARAYGWLDDALKRAGQPQEAEEAHRHAVMLQKDLAGNYPNVPSYREELANLHLQRAEAMRIAWRIDEAEQAYHAAIELLEGLVLQHPQAAAYEQQLALAWDRLDEIEENRTVADVVIVGKSSLSGVKQAIAAARAVDVEADSGNAVSDLVYAEYLALSGDFERSATLAQRAIRRGGRDCWYYKSLGWALYGAGRMKEAIAAFQQAIEAADETGANRLIDLHPDALTAAYFLDLITRQEFTDRLARDMMTGAKLACYPWFYVGLRMELSGDREAALAAYHQCIALGQGPSAHHTVVWASYRLSVLEGRHEPPPLWPEEDTTVDDVTGPPLPTDRQRGARPRSGFRKPWEEGLRNVVDPGRAEIEGFEQLMESRR